MAPTVAPAAVLVTVLVTVLVAALAAGLPVAAGPAHADPKPTAERLKRELATLQKDTDRLITDYYDSRIAHQRADKAARAARAKLAAAQQVYDLRSTELRALAVAHYTGARPDQATLLASGADPGALLNRLALVQHLVTLQDARLRGFARVRDERARAQEETAARAEELERALGELEERKEKAEKQIERVKDKIDQLYRAPGMRPDGTFVPQLPQGPDNITPRMALVKQLIAERFEVPFGIGCYRAIQDGGEHPLGRACDFMLSRGGALPSAAERARGDRIAAWAIKNARRLGIMYIIYRQRIWHARTGTWRAMSDRGGTTANHYDHPHISVY
ncbi:coiled-coil domain-containing protein [Nonomuraea sp. NPDC050783]|uniref:coiled-coil domain-containing protein n=1 Tax=Nonomuraea sp. NPDC050783 TaxID=3154634 RepID=UPI003466B3FF